MANLRTNNLSGEQGQNAYRGSLYFNGIESADFLTLASSSDFDFSTGDVTVEAWVFMSSHPSHSHIFSTSNFDLKVSGGKIRLFTTSGETDTSRSVTVGHWHHIAAVRAASINSGNWKVYLNGVGVNYSLGSVDSGDSVAEVSGRVRTSDEEFHGFISNLRVVNGTAVYTSDFTPPTSELTLIPNTVLLCCQDTDNPLQEATGKTITGFGRYADTSAELVPNGGPTTDVTGWTAYNSSVAYDAGHIKVTRSGGSGVTAYATITTVVGQRYRLSAQVRSPDSRGDISVYTSVGSGELLRIFGTAGATVELSGEFTATATTLYVHTVIDDDGDICYYNRVSVKAADQGILQKFIPPYGVDAGNTFGGPIQQSSEGYMYFPTGRTEERGRGRVVIFGGTSTNGFFEMSTGGIANVFGSANFTIQGQHASCSSTTRAVRLNGYSPSTAPVACNVMEFVTIATQSNATDFGDSTRACRYNTGFGSQTRGINANGNTPGAVNIIDFITIATTGDATDFGDLTLIDKTLAGSTSNSTRGLINGCEPGTNITEFVTIATTGNAQDFGDSTVAKEGRKGAASSTRAIFASGYSHPTFQTVNTIDFFTIATTGNAVDFGDLTYISGAAGGTSNSVRAVIMGGFTTPGNTTDTIDIVTIATTGDATDFGDMHESISTADAATSDCHGGLS